MASTFLSGQFDAIIHAAAVNDYHVVGTYARQSDDGSFIDVSTGKVKSSHQDLWIRLQPAPKLVDKIRTDWRFAGTLVKFKLEVGVTDTELLDIAERSRQHSDADFMVANTLEGMHEWAYLGSAEEGYERFPRTELAERLVWLLEESIGRTPQLSTALNQHILQVIPKAKQELSTEILLSAV